jgi:uncharacterized membrane protein
MMLRLLTRTFFKGLVVVLPFVAAVYVFLWIVRDGEAVVRALLIKVIPEENYLPGLGLGLVVVGVFCVGLLMYPWVTRKLLDSFDGLLRRIPLFGAIYSPVRDLMDVLDGEVERKLDQVVLIKIPNTDVETLGFITRDDLSDLPDGFSKEGHVVVYVQWSYQIGGYCFVVPRESVQPVHMTIQQGMRWALTAGISAPKNAGQLSETTDTAEAPA